MSKVRMAAGAQTATGRGIERTFLTWRLVRAIFHRGYVLASSLYFVLDAGLTASQLLLLGTAMALALLVCDVPVGALADTIGRRWPLALGHAFLAAGMILTGLVTSFPVLVVTQLLWGTGWGLSMGADVAWLTDELGQIKSVTAVVAAGGRRELFGGAMGIVGFGLLGLVAGLQNSVVISGVGMSFVGVFVAVRFTERGFQPDHQRTWRTPVSVLGRAVRLARADREIRVVLAATMLVNGAAMVAWLFARRLADLGFPVDPALWYAAFGITGFLIGSPTLAIVAARVDSDGGARTIYALACGIGVLGLSVIAFAPDALLASVGIAIVTAVAFNITRTVSVIWINRRTASGARATVLSLLSQAETVGEILAGTTLGLLAEHASVPGILICAAGLIASAAALVVRFGAASSTRAA